MDEMAPTGEQDAFDIPESDQDLSQMSAWIGLSTAHRFLGRFTAVLAPQEPWDALLSALRSGLLSAQCDDSEPMAGHPSAHLHATRSLGAREWAEATQLNLWDNAINLRSGAVAKDIEVSKYRLYDWLLARPDADPDWWFEDFKAFADDNGYTLTSDTDGDVAKIESPTPPKNKGGRPSKYKWEQILIEYLVPAIYLGSITKNTTLNELGRQISDSAASVSPDQFPDAEYAEERFAAPILAALIKADKQA